VLIYLAAAVSDFTIPHDQKAIHKIQSSKGLDIHLDQVPKLLGVLTSAWAPHAYVISFKLETDSEILVTKARRAIDHYHVHGVVANILHTRKDVVYLVFPDDAEVYTITRPSDVAIIEPFLIEALDARHVSYIETTTSGIIATAHMKAITNVDNPCREHISRFCNFKFSS
jgi:phosphopantothenate-cysteine ligase